MGPPRLGKPRLLLRLEGRVGGAVGIMDRECEGGRGLSSSRITWSRESPPKSSRELSCLEPGCRALVAAQGDALYLVISIRVLRVLDRTVARHTSPVPRELSKGQELFCRV